MTAPHRDSRRSPISRLLLLLLLALESLLGGCAFLQVRLDVRPGELVIIPGDSVRVTITADPVPLRFQDPPCDTPGLCLDLTGQVFDYVVQDLPPGVSHTVDTSLRTPSTPGLVRITFASTRWRLRGTEPSGPGGTTSTVSSATAPTLAGTHRSV